MMRNLVAALAGLTMLGVSAAQASPNGVWELETRDTRIALALCGDGTQLCGTLVWLSDAEYNKQYQPYLNTPVATEIVQNGANRWKGDMRLFGQKFTGTITQRSDTQMTLQGCAFLVVCKSYEMFKYSE